MGIDAFVNSLYVVALIFVLWRIKVAGFDCRKVFSWPTGSIIFVLIGILVPCVGPNHLLYIFVGALNDLNGSLLFAENIHNIIAAVILAPIVEELIFRFWLLKLFFEKMHPTVALLLTNAIFGLVHTDHMIQSFIDGMLFSLLFLRTGSLLVSILAHSITNLSGYFVYPHNDELFWGKFNEAGRSVEDGSYSVVLFSNALIWVLAIFLLVCFSRRYLSRSILEQVLVRMKSLSH